MIPTSAALHARPRKTSSDKMEANVEKSPLIRFFDELDFKQTPVSVKRKKKEECPSGLILIDSNCDKAVVSPPNLLLFEQSMNNY